METHLVPEEIMKKQVESYNDKDIEKFIECFSEDVEFFDLKDGKRKLNGIGELREAFTGLFTNSPELKLVIKNRIIVGNFVTDHEFVTGVKKYPNGGEVISINLIENGKVRKIWFSEVMVCE
jgi:hypothetical protein